MLIIDEIYKKYKNDSTINSIIELENKFFEDENYKEYMALYLEKQMRINGYDKKKFKAEGKYELYEEKENQLKNNLFFSKILTIDLNDVDNCIYILYFMSNIYKMNNAFFDVDEEFKNLLSRLEINVDNEDYTQDLKKIIEDESFLKDIKEILNCNSVKNYFEKVRSFSEKDEDYDVKFVLEEKEIVDDNDDCLKEGFHKLMKNLEKDKNYLSKIIIFKYLPKYNRAFVDPNMRIAINPIYFEFSKSLDENKKNNIFKAYLIIIILHEIVHLLKFMKEEKISFENIPKTPKGKEGGKMFINYIFNLAVIYYITNDQASIINYPENWKNFEKISTVFMEQKEWFEKNKIDKGENEKRPSCEEKDSISFYLSLLENNNNEINFKENIDDWYDMD